MVGIGLVFFCCVMFIHLGMGDTLSSVFHLDFVLFRCVKCLTFWSVLAYSFFFVELTLLESVSLGFLLSYISLWVDLILSKIANKYDNWYEQET